MHHGYFKALCVWPDLFLFSAPLCCLNSPFSTLRTTKLQAIPGLLIVRCKQICIHPGQMLTWHVLWLSFEMQEMTVFCNITSVCSLNVTGILFLCLISFHDPVTSPRTYCNIQSLIHWGCQWRMPTSGNALELTLELTAMSPSKHFCC